MTEREQQLEELVRQAWESLYAAGLFSPDANPGRIFLAFDKRCRELGVVPRRPAP